MHPGLFFAIAPTVGTFDFLLNWYLFFGVGAAVVVLTMLGFFIARYRSRGETGPPAEHKTEGWKIVLITALISLSVLGAAEYQTFASFGNIVIPNDPNAVHIGVVGYQWGWNFTYPNGKFELNNLTVPANRTVILTLESRDVFHTFGISTLAVKEDAIPGKTNSLWFLVPDTGFHKNAIRCFELCGVGHAFMVANLTVVGEPTWDAWIGG